MSTKMTSIRLPEDLRDELDAWIADQRIPPKRTDVIVLAIKEFLAREKPVKRKGN